MTEPTIFFKEDKANSLFIGMQSLDLVDKIAGLALKNGKQKFTIDCHAREKP